MLRATGYARMVSRALPNVAWPAARSAALWAFCRRQNAPEGRLNMKHFGHNVRLYNILEKATDLKTWLESLSFARASRVQEKGDHAITWAQSESCQFLDN